MYADECPLAMA